MPVRVETWQQPRVEVPEMSILVQAVRYPFMAIRLWKPHPIAVFMLKLWSPALILLAFCVGKFLIPLLLSNLR